jgi:hypothetical protein
MAPITSIIPCTRHSGEPFARIEVLFNDRATFFMYVDTGRLTTAISHRVRAALGLEVSRRRVNISNRQIIGLDRTLVDSFVIAGFPETEVAPLAVHVTAVQFADGRIGMNYLSRFLRVCYDFEGQTLQLTR